MAKEDKGQWVVIEGEGSFRLTLHEITISLGVTSDVIEAILEEGAVSVRTDASNEMLFDNEALRQIRTMLKLNRDLGVNWAGAALALELLSEIERLQRLLPQPYDQENHE